MTTNRLCKPIDGYEEWNPWFVLYAWNRGELDPKRQLDSDHDMAEYMEWIRGMWSKFFVEFPALSGDKRRDNETIIGFDNWLKKRIGRPLKKDNGTWWCCSADYGEHDENCRHFQGKHSKSFKKNH